MLYFHCGSKSCWKDWRLKVTSTTLVQSTSGVNIVRFLVPFLVFKGRRQFSKVLWSMIADTQKTQELNTPAAVHLLTNNVWRPILLQSIFLSIPKTASYICSHDGMDLLVWSRNGPGCHNFACVLCADFFENMNHPSLGLGKSHGCINSIDLKRRVWTKWNGWFFYLYSMNILVNALFDLRTLTLSKIFESFL